MAEPWVQSCSVLESGTRLGGLGCAPGAWGLGSHPARGAEAGSLDECAEPDGALLCCEGQRTAKSRGVQVVLRERGVQRTSWVKIDGLERSLHAPQGQCQETDSFFFFF